jgi:hypothetical protein
MAELMHTHACYACGATITCVCPDRRDVDRVTGRPRRLYCMFCSRLRDELSGLSGLEALFKAYEAASGYEVT